MTAPRQPNWDELRTFVEVARDGSLSGAARRLGLSQPTVGRHIDALEAVLGSALFARSPRGLTPTPAALTSDDGSSARASSVIASWLFVRAERGRRRRAAWSAIRFISTPSSVKRRSIAARGSGRQPNRKRRPLPGGAFET